MNMSPNEFVRLSSVAHLPWFTHAQHLPRVLVQYLEVHTDLEIFVLSRLPRPHSSTLAPNRRTRCLRNAGLDCQAYASTHGHANKPAPLLLLPPSAVWRLNWHGPRSSFSFFPRPFRPRHGRFSKQSSTPLSMRRPPPSHVDATIARDEESPKSKISG